MDMIKSKKGFGSTAGLSIGKVIGVIIGIILLFGVLAALYPTLVIYADNLSAIGLPLGGLLAASFVGLLLAAAVVMAVYKALMPKT